MLDELRDSLGVVSNEDPLALLVLAQDDGVASPNLPSFLCQIVEFRTDCDFVRPVLAPNFRSLSAPPSS